MRIFETPIEEAKRLGAQMLFGEKYGDVVRVVEIDGASRELCGGTHVRSTAEIKPFVITSEARSARVRAESRPSPPGGSALLHERARKRRGCAASSRRRARVRKRTVRVSRPTTRSPARRPPATSPCSWWDVTSGDPLDVSDKLKQQHAPAAVIVGLRDNGAAQLVINWTSRRRAASTPAM